MAICSVCKLMKPYFQKGMCHQCGWRYYREKYKQKRSANRKLYYALHRAEVRSYNHNYWMEHRDELIKKKRISYQKHHAEILAYAQHYREKNRELLNAKAMQVYWKNPAKSMTKTRKYYADHPSYKKMQYTKHRERNLLYGLRYNLGLRMSLMEQLGGVYCRTCGFNDVRALHYDHIHNDGMMDRKRFKDVASFMRYYLEHVDEATQKLQVLCANCNLVKAIRKREQNLNQAYGNIRQRKYHHRLKESLFNQLGGKCVRCATTYFDVLQLDHINGHGRSDYKHFRKMYYMYSYYLDHLDEAKQKLQILCANCNWIKKHEQNETQYGYIQKGDRISAAH